MPPDRIHAPAGCPFYPRCTFREPRNELEMPPLRSITAGHEVACWVDIHEAKPHEIVDETLVKVGAEQQIIADQIEDEKVVGTGVQ